LEFDGIHSNFAELLSIGDSYGRPTPFDISGTTVVWSGWDGCDMEIYMGTWDGGTVPAPGAVLLAGIGAGLVGWLRRRRAL
jgi:hypothetical protein